jgi:FkbM family methyltransferase
VWAFEPNPTNFAAARATADLNDLDNVELRNAALSNQDGALLFRTHGTNGTPRGGLSRVAVQEGPGVTSVDAVMLDYAVPLDRPVSILQLDVEGHEKQALLGAFHIIQRWRPILILEYFDQLRWFGRNFRSIGCQCVGKLHSNFVYATEPMAL